MRLASWPRVALAIGATVIAVYAISVALAGESHAGIDTGDTGTTVQSVQPDSIAWDAGFRDGQVITWMRGGDAPGGMAVQTAEAGGGQPVLFGPMELLLRASVLFGLLALVLGVLAVPAAGQPARRAELLAVIAIVLATIPVAIAYQRTIGLVVIGAAAVAPWVWFARWGGIDRRPALAALAIGAGLWVGWLALRLADPIAAVTLRNIIGVWVAVSAVLLLVLGARMTPRRVATTVATVGVVDVLVIAGVAIAAVALVSLQVNVLVVAAMLVLALAVFIVTRRRLAAGMDKLLLAELRERTALQATEDERARVAREIHDDPLQQIAGVIRELERADPDPAAATASLRDVAARLRGVATELRPPALDDLGLVPAIDGLARQVAEPPVEVRIDNQAGFGRAQRPPGDVELAAFRIVQEAVANAARHAGASRIAVTGTVAMDRIDLVIADDGRGMDPKAIEAAQRAGHMGVGSMRARASAIGGDLDIAPAPAGGTTVTLRWRA